MDTHRNSYLINSIWSSNGFAHLQVSAFFRRCFRVDLVAIQGHPINI